MAHRKTKTLRALDWQYGGPVLFAVLLFFTICFSSGSTIKGTALLLTILVLAAVFPFFSRLRDRFRAPVIALALVVLADGVSTFYAVSGKFALYEFLKVLISFCIALLMLAVPKDEDGQVGLRCAAVLEGSIALMGLVSIDMISTRLLSGPVLGFWGVFAPDYAQVDGLEVGVRMTSLFLNPNIFVGCAGIGVLLSPGLALSSERRVRLFHLSCLYLNSLAFILAFSMEASGAIALAFLLYLVFEVRERRPALLLLMVETLLLTVLSAALISMTSFTAWTGPRPVPILCAVLGMALVFMAGHAAVEVVFSSYSYLPLAFGVFALITLCAAPSEAGEKKRLKTRALLASSALLGAFGVLLICNMQAQSLSERATSLSDLEQAVFFDRFEWADHMLSYVLNSIELEVDGATRSQADRYAERLSKVSSNAIPIYLAEYYLSTGRTQRGMEMVEKYVDYVSSDPDTWNQAFGLLEYYDTGDETYRTGVAHIYQLLQNWSAVNMGEITLSEAAAAYIARTLG